MTTAHILTSLFFMIVGESQKCSAKRRMANQLPSSHRRSDTPASDPAERGNKPLPTGSLLTCSKSLCQIRRPLGYTRPRIKSLRQPSGPSALCRSRESGGRRPPRRRKSAPRPPQRPSPARTGRPLSQKGAPRRRSRGRATAGRRG